MYNYSPYVFVYYAAAKYNDFFPMLKAALLMIKVLYFVQIKSCFECIRYFMFEVVHLHKIGGSYNQAYLVSGVFVILTFGLPSLLCM